MDQQCLRRWSISQGVITKWVSEEENISEDDVIKMFCLAASSRREPSKHMRGFFFPRIGWMSVADRLERATWGQLLKWGEKNGDRRTKCAACRILRWWLRKSIMGTLALSSHRHTAVAVRNSCQFISIAEQFSAQRSMTMEMTWDGFFYRWLRVCMCCFFYYFTAVKGWFFSGDRVLLRNVRLMGLDREGVCVLERIYRWAVCGARVRRQWCRKAASESAHTGLGYQIKSR